jgi:restriction endonuclease S subunit
MPFGLKGITHAECCERVKELKIRGTKSEPLFLQLMMVSLNRGGRCAVVVPDGMLVNSSECHDGTRKYLMDHFELKRVIKMRGQFFMNTGIQPSILFFENTGNPTTAVEFWDVIKGSNGSIEETMVLSVSRDKLGASCSLDMRRYQEVKEVANPSRFPMVKLSDICNDVSTSKNIPSSERKDGEFRFFTCSRDYSNHNASHYDGTYLIHGSRGSTISESVFTTDNEKFAIGTSMFVSEVKDKNKVNTKYLYYYLKFNKGIVDTLVNSSAIPMISKTSYYTIEILLPPLPIQQEIVATLDRIYQPGTTELAETLKLTTQAMDLVLAQPNGATLEPIVEAQRLMRKSAQMVADVKAQMVADVKAQMVAIVKAIAHGCKTGTTIGNLYDTPSCKKKFNSGDMDNSGDVPFFNGKFNSPVGTHSDYSFDSEHEYFVMIKDGGGDHSSDSVGMGKFFNVKGKSAITSHNLILVPKTFNEALHKFMRIYLYCHGKEIRDKARYSLSLGSISVKDILNFPVPNMSADQLTNANIRLTALQSQLIALENLGKQAEDNARFILESYLESSHPLHGGQDDALISVNNDNEDKEDEEKEDVSTDAVASSNLVETELTKKTVPVLKELAKTLGVKSPSKMKKDDLVKYILEKQRD